MVELLGLIHFVSYFLSPIGTAQQYFVINKDKNSYSQKGRKTKGLSTRYRVYDNFLYLAEFFWGLSLHPVNWIVSFGNFISLIFPTLILLEIWYDRQEKSIKNWFFIYLGFISLNVVLMIFDWEAFKSFSQILGWVTLVLCFLSVFGLVDNTRIIIRDKDPGKQSLIEIVLKLIKDFFGIAYGFAAGIDVMWPLVAAFAVRGAARLTNFAAFLYYSQKKSTNRRTKGKYSYAPSNNK